MNGPLLFVSVLLVALLFISPAASQCSVDALLKDPYFSLSPDWETNGACGVGIEDNGSPNTRTCKVPDAVVFSAASGWRQTGAIEVTDIGRETLDRFSVRLLNDASIEADFTFNTSSPLCALRWQDFTTLDIAFNYVVDIVDSEGNSLGGSFPHTQATDDTIACDFSGCNIDARDIQNWGLPAAGTYTVRFSGVSGQAEGAGPLVTDICVACTAPSPSPSSSTSHSASSSKSRTPSSSTSRSASSSTSRSPSSSTSHSPSSSISKSSSVSQSRAPSKSSSSSISLSSSSSISLSSSSSISLSSSSSISLSSSSSISVSRAPSKSSSSSISVSPSSSSSASSSPSSSASPSPVVCEPSPSPCPEPSPEPCDPCARKHNKQGDITININFSRGGNPEVNYS